MRFWNVGFALIFSFILFSTTGLAQNVSHFYGTIGDFPIEMELTNTKGKVNGWYWYPGKSEKLGLEGSLSNDSILSLKERNSRQNLTGFFKGSFQSSYRCEGVWQSGDLSKEFNFVLKLDNNVSLFTGYRMSESEEMKPTQQRMIDTPSKIRGLSKLWLWILIFVVLIVIALVLILRNLNGKLKKKPKIVVEKEVEKHVHYVSESMDSDSSMEAEKGKLFEEYVVGMFRNKKEYFEWMDATSDKKYGDHYPKSNHNPDLIIRFKNQKQGWEEDLAVECKFRLGHQNSIVYIDKAHKISNYQSFAKNQNINTFLALGCGGYPDNPSQLFIIPINKVKSKMSTKELLPYTNKRDYFFYDFNSKSLT